jgi:hypothetical protein
VRVATKTALPQAVAENYSRGCARQIFFRREPTSEQGLHPEQREKIRGDSESVHLVGVAPGDDQVNGKPLKYGDALK